MKKIKSKSSGASDSCADAYPGTSRYADAPADPRSASSWRRFIVDMELALHETCYSRVKQAIVRRTSDPAERHRMQPTKETSGP